MRAVTLSVVALAALGLGALRVTPADDGDDAPEQAFNVVGASSSPTITILLGTTTTLPPTTAAPTTAPPTTVGRTATTRAPLSPLAPSPPTTRPPTPTTAPPPPSTVANRPPVARADQAKLQEGSATVAVLANDGDPDGQLDTSRLFIVSEPGAGHATVNGDRITYFADSGFNSSDSFRYRIYDDDGAFAEALVTITR
jgi:hypothetical protein